MYVQGFLVITTFILSNHQLPAFDGIELIRNVGNNLCPYTNYCHTNASEEFNHTDDDMRPSCLPCSCDADCWLLGNCCPDKEETTEHTLILPCKLSKVKEMINRKSSFSLKDILKQRAGANYRVIDTCPPYETNGTLLQRCQGSDTLSARTLSEYIWVSDSITGLIYQNIYCIKCHAIEQFWYWRIQTSCMDILNVDVNAETLLSMDCDIINVAPESKAALVVKYQCFDYKLEDFDLNCNMNAELNYDFVTACKRSTWPYLNGFARSIFLYKNVFCFACQFGIEAINHAILISGRGVPLMPFSALLNYQAPHDGSKNAREQSCHSGQVADPHTVST